MNFKVLDLRKENYSILNWLEILLKFRTFDTNTPTSCKIKLYILENFYIDVEEYDVIIGYRADDSYFSFAKDLLERGLKMAIKFYDVKYLDSVATNIGTMFEYAVACGYELKVYWDMFTCSTVTKQIENGNLKFLVCYFRN